MKSGGYQIIDLQDKELTMGVGMIYEGIYDKIEGTRKAILLSGLNVEGTEYHDTFVSVGLDGTTYHLSYVNDYVPFSEITIQDNDVLTVVEK